MDDTLKAASQAQHETAVQSSRDDRMRMLKALSALESALAAGATSRQTAWNRRVMAVLAVLAETMEAQTRELDSGEGLLAEILNQAPRFERAVHQLRDHYADLVRQIESLRKEFTDAGETDVGEIRHRLAWLITAIRHFQARESDLLQDAFQIDIGGGD